MLNPSLTIIENHVVAPCAMCTNINKLILILLCPKLEVLISLTLKTKVLFSIFIKLLFVSLGVRAYLCQNFRPRDIWLSVGVGNKNFPHTDEGTNIFHANRGGDNSMMMISMFIITHEMIVKQTLPEA